MPIVQTGLENLAKSPPSMLRERRIGLLCNPASVDSRFRHARDIVSKCYPGCLTTLFSPQHGFFADKQDNMIESDHMRDPISDIPVFSLYGQTRIPTSEMFKAIDILLVDLQDVGTRVYTFIYTLSYCMEKARELSKPVVILDRPNPLGGLEMEGNCISEDCASFVGRYPIPMRHGLTIGEIARLFNERFGIGCDLSVIPMTGWNRNMHFRDTGLPWVAPSPNLPTPESAEVYPGQVIWEGTNISEGRGTTQPFEFFGAPFFDIQQLLKEQPKWHLEGVHLRPIAFEPTSNKWRGRLCWGFQLHVTDPTTYRPYLLSLQLLQSAIQNHPDAFEWKKPPYEYEFHRKPVDLILGDKTLRQQIERGVPAASLASDWDETINAYRKEVEAIFIY